MVSQVGLLTGDLPGGKGAPRSVGGSAGLQLKADLGGTDSGGWGPCAAVPKKGFRRVRSHSPGAMRTVAWRRAPTQGRVLLQHQGQRQRVAAESGPRTGLGARAQGLCADNGLLSLNMENGASDWESQLPCILTRRRRTREVSSWLRSHSRRDTVSGRTGLRSPAVSFHHAHN